MVAHESEHLVHEDRGFTVAEPAHVENLRRSLHAARPEDPEQQLLEACVLPRRWGIIHEWHDPTSRFLVESAYSVMVTGLVNHYAANVELRLNLTEPYPKRAIQFARRARTHDWAEVSTSGVASSHHVKRLSPSVDATHPGKAAAVPLCPCVCTWLNRRCGTEKSCIHAWICRCILDDWHGMHARAQ